MCTLKRVLSAGGMLLHQCTALPVRNVHAYHGLRSPKRRSPYNSEDSERYSSLVKSAMSHRVSSQTPESLRAEDEHIYGRVIKTQTPVPKAERKEPKNNLPFLLCEKTLEMEEPEAGPPARILLKRGPGGSSSPSVTRILQRTLSPEQTFYLDRWKKKMIAELGQEGFYEYSQKLFSQGKRFHSVLEDTLTSSATRMDEHPSETPDYPPEVQGYMESVSHVLEDIRAVRATESTVHHDTLNYLGIVDCVARYRGVLCVIDWKTSEKPKPFLSNTYDNPIQVAAYAGALNKDENYKYQVEHGLIVVAYKDGSPAHAHKMDPELMLRYWQTWLLRLEQFTEQSASSENK